MKVQLFLDFFVIFASKGASLAFPCLIYLYTEKYP